MAPIAMAVNAMKARTRWTMPLPCCGVPSMSSAKNASRPEQIAQVTSRARPGAGAAVRAEHPGQGAGDGQGQGAAQQEVQVHHPEPRAAAVVAFRVVDQAVPGPQEGQQDVDGHVDGDPGEREPGQRLRAGRGGALPRRRDGGSHRDPRQGGSRRRPRVRSRGCTRDICGQETQPGCISLVWWDHGRGVNCHISVRRPARADQAELGRPDDLPSGRARLRRLPAQRRGRVADAVARARCRSAGLARAWA